MKEAPSHPTDRQRLTRLRKLDAHHPWASLDDPLHCALCEQTITGRTIRIVRQKSGKSRLACPTSGCRGTPSHWVTAGNPLISDAAWRDWMRLLGSLCDDLRPRPVVRRLQPAIALAGREKSNWPN